MQSKMSPPEPPPARPCGGSERRQPPENCKISFLDVVGWYWLRGGIYGTYKLPHWKYTAISIGGRVGGGGGAESDVGWGGMYIYFHILLYTSIYLQIPPNTVIYLYIPLYTPTYIKISNIRKMRSDTRPQNGHNSGPRGSPMARIWHVPSYYTPKGFFKPKGPQF